MSELISIIIPTYNRAKVVGRAIHSALQQTYPHTEVIVVDDGSSDNTAEIVRTLDPRVNYLPQTNQGASAARNNGIKLARGSYIAFLDSDDFWNSDKLEKQLACFHQYPDIGMVDTNVRFLDAQGTTVDPPREFIYVKPAQNRMRDLAYLFQYPYLGTPTVMIRKSILDTVGYFDTSLKTAEDIDLWLRVAEVAPAYYLAEKLTTVCQLDAGLSTNLVTYTDNLCVIDNFLKRNPRFAPQHPWLVRRVYATVYYKYGVALLQGGNKPAAQKMLLQSLQHKPGWRGTKALLKSLLPG